MAKTDLNLVVIFDAIMKEKSITAAADSLAMTQPSVSNAVSRMRHAWKDPLFVKDGRGIRPTPYASKLWKSVAEPLAQISHAIAPDYFDPLTSKASFRIGITDGSASIVWPELRHIIEQEAPNINIYAVPYKVDGELLLNNADVDLVFDYYDGTSNEIKSKTMYENHFVTVMRADHDLAEQALTLENYLKSEHLLVSLSGDICGIVDDKLAELDSKRRTAMTVNSFASAINLIKQTRLIITMPYPIIAEHLAAGDLVLKPVPLKLPSIKISLAWHSRNNHSQALKWLIGVLDRIIESKRHLFDFNLPHA
ncbi:LysR family transcriptional regulator [Marinomonas sp. PE14-40]|uniref:LysR family transcriptional regulator n=1 Tax=Marinomonas sp. PE14-40 TaxID=3060621 RepID=UPI003F66218B